MSRQSPRVASVIFSNTPDLDISACTDNDTELYTCDSSDDNSDDLLKPILGFVRANGSPLFVVEIKWHSERAVQTGKKSSQNLEYKGLSTMFLYNSQ